MVFAVRQVRPCVKREVTVSDPAIAKYLHASNYPLLIVHAREANRHSISIKQCLEIHQLSSRITASEMALKDVLPPHGDIYPER